jgi:glycosyltransferase involved in cell wall biosynthesis
LKILHWQNQEDSGLTNTTRELVKYEELAGHTVAIRQPTGGGLLYGRLTTKEYDIACAHHQMDPQCYHDGKPKFLWCHGEPLSSVGNGISMKAVVEMAPMCSAFIAMRKEEVAVWKAIKPETYLVDKGIDLEVYKPIPAGTNRLSGEPAVLYYENWRGQRNPLYWCIAMQEVHRKYPNARLHLYNCTDKRMYETFTALNAHCHWWPFLRTITGAEKEINGLLNKVDIVISGLHPLYARSIEAFGAGKAFISPGYKEHNYPWTCDYDPASMADAIIKCHENYDQVNYRKWAEDHHDVKNTVAQSMEIYKRFM